MYIIFAAYSLSFTISPPPSILVQPPRPGQGRTCSVLLFFNSVLKKKKEKNDIFGVLKLLHREFPCDTS
jgi:hypothetical protein